MDWKRTLGATVLTLVGSNDSYGGSTITQQMLKNLTGENQNTINRKVKEDVYKRQPWWRKMP